MDSPEILITGYVDLNDPLTLCGHIKTAEQQQYADWYTGC